MGSGSCNVLTAPPPPRSSLSDGHLRIYYKDCNSDCLSIRACVCVYFPERASNLVAPDQLEQIITHTYTQTDTHTRVSSKTGNTFEVDFDCYCIKKFYSTLPAPPPSPYLGSLIAVSSWKNGGRVPFIIYFTIVT